MKTLSQQERRAIAAFLILIGLVFAASAYGYFTGAWDNSKSELGTGTAPPQSRP